ncbi:MAG: hypothetical protein WA814_08210 [Candidatus Baltobacteraceae bacterium]
MLTRLVAALAVASLAIVPSVAGADQSMGQLVYSFTYSSDQQTTARDASDSAEAVSSDVITGGTNGQSHYEGKLNDKGTMNVDVQRKQTDGGLVVTISEQGENTRRAPAATCVVYGNTRVICDPNKTVYTEEYTLLRFLGSNFVDPNQLDANKHWAITQDGPSLAVKADYTINANNNGTMQIGETRSLRQPGGSLTTDVQTKIAYDYKRTVPTSVDEYVTQRHDNGVQGTSTTIYQTTLKLVSDSVASQ